METLRPLRHVVRPTSGPAGSARREAWTGALRSQAVHGIAIPALALLSLGATAAASPGHTVSGPVHASAYQLASRLTLQAPARSVRACVTAHRPWTHVARGSRPLTYTPARIPWMFTATIDRPWIYTPARIPWMFTVTSTYRPRTYAPARTPWMFGPPNSLTGAAACPAGTRPS